MLKGGFTGAVHVDNSMLGWQDKFDNEKKKREKTEQENKKLLYQINKMLRRGVDVDVDADLSFDNR